MAEFDPDAQKNIRLRRAPKMKRYWKLAVLVPLTVLCIGTYYVQASGGDLPDMYLKTLAGNEQEAARLSVDASFTKESLRIQTGGAVYSGQSFWQSLAPRRYGSAEFDKLMKEHRQFMRGKTNLNAIFEDDSVIGYANIDPQFYSGSSPAVRSIQVSVEDKKRKVGSTFGVDLPKNAGLDFISIADVQISGSTLKLLAIYYFSGSLSNKSVSPDVHLYTVDLGTKKLLEDKTMLMGNPQDADHRADFRGIQQSKITAPSRYAVVERTLSKIENKTDMSMRSIPETKDLYVCDVQSGSSEAIDNEVITGLLKGEQEPQIFQSGDELVILSGSDAQDLRLIRYNLPDKLIKKDHFISSKDLNGGVPGLSRIADNRLYMLLNPAPEPFASPTVAIADLDSGAVVYRGAVTRKDNKQLLNFMINDLVIE
jgi:hypothetical protein